MKPQNLVAPLLLISILMVLVGCNGMYLTGPAHPYEWATAETVATASTSANPPLADDKIVTSCNKQNEHAKVHLEQPYFPAVVCVDMARLTQLEARYYGRDVGKPAQKDDRDQWVQILMRDIDVLWWGYKNGFLSMNDSTKVTADTIVTGTAAASAGVTAVGGKTALAVIAATLNGFNSSFDKDVLANQTAPVLFTAAETQRTAVETQIIKRLKLQTNDYSLAIASRDVMRYANAGSLSNALASISGQAGQAMTNVNKDRDAASSGTSENPASAPTGLKAVRNGSQASIAFTPPADTSNGAVLMYELLAQPDSGTEWRQDVLAQDVKNNTFTVDQTLNSGTYTFTLYATTKVGQGAASQPYELEQLKP